MKLFLVKSIPKTPWSSDAPLNFKPAAKTLLILCFGLVVFGIGEALLIAAGIGVSPWTVLAQGVSNISGWSIGVATFVVGIAVLLLWIPLSQTPGLGTLLNIIVISAAIEIFLPYLPEPESYIFKILEIALGILMVGFGSGLYLIANLGPGPRDGLMTGVQRVTDFPVARVRTALEITAVAFGWLLGGTVGLGTLMFAFGIGPAVSVGLFTVHHFSNKTN